MAVSAPSDSSSNPSPRHADVRGSPVLYTFPEEPIPFSEAGLSWPPYLSGNRCAASASLQPASTMSHSSAVDQTAATTVSNSVHGFAPYHPPPHQLRQPMSGSSPPAPPSVPLPSRAPAPSMTSSDRALYAPPPSGPPPSGPHGLFIPLCG